MSTPVLIFSYTRLDSLKKVLEKINKNKVNDTDLYIFSDGYKNENDKEKVEIVREYIFKFKNKNNFKNVEIIVSETNKGVDRSIIEGVSLIIKKYGSVIVLEDDIVVSDTFVEYMNMCLNYYKNEDRVFSVGGYCPDIELHTNNVFFFPRIESWGWGIWKDRWDSIDWDLNGFDEFSKSDKSIDAFNRGGNDLFEILCAHKEAWDVRTCYTAFKKSAYTVYPPISLVQNIGFNGDGVHFKESTNKYDTTIINGYMPMLIPFNINDEISKKMYNFYSIPSYKYTLKKIKRKLKRIV